MTPLVNEAREFATLQHSGQYRKHSNRPYLYHPEQVYLYLSSKGYTDEDLLVSAWLHDVVEDCNTTYEDLAERFGGKVAALVREVSHPDTSGNREQRWEVYLRHYEKASPLGRALKLADRYYNLQEYVDFWHEVPRSDRKFLDQVYLNESVELLDTLRGTDRYIEKDLLDVIFVLDNLLTEALA